MQSNRRMGVVQYDAKSPKDILKLATSANTYNQASHPPLFDLGNAASKYFCIQHIGREWLHHLSSSNLTFLILIYFLKSSVTTRHLHPFFCGYWVWIWILNRYFGYGLDTQIFWVPNEFLGWIPNFLGYFARF